MSGRRFVVQSRMLGGMGDTLPVPGSTRQARRAKAAVARRSRRDSRWEKVDHRTYALVRAGKRVAAVWFLGGHVERPDQWCVTFAAENLKALGGGGWDSIEDAKTFAEERTAKRPDEEP